MLKNNFLSVKNILTAIIFSISTIWVAAQNIVWEKNYGGIGADLVYSGQKTSDGGFVMVGYTQSSANGDVSGASKGGNDVWVVKLDASGNIAWQKNYGGFYSEIGMDIKQTPDGGYIVLANTYSSASGDVTGVTNGTTTSDVWVLKLDASGNIIWQKTYGGTETEAPNSIQLTSDGGYIFAASSLSSASGNFTGASKGGQDLWVVKLNATGDIQWQNNYGGSGDDIINSIIQTAEGGYMLVGNTASSASGDMTGASKGGKDVWMLKLDASGNITWEKNYGGTATDAITSLKQTADGGYILAGYTQSSATGDVTGTSKGSYDIWVVKVTSTGSIVWQKNIGGSGADVGYSIQLEADGGYILGGYTASSANGDITRASKGGNDFWLVKLDSVGTIKWEKNFGGAGTDMALSLDKTSDGGYALLGYSNSSAGGDFSAASKGSYDFWALKVDVSSLSISNVAHSAINLYPNPAKDFVTLSNMSKGADVRVYDMTGKELYQTKAAGTSITINTSAYKNGVYLLKVNGEVTKLLIAK